MPDCDTDVGNEEEDPWLQVWDKLDESIKKSFGRALNENDVKEAKSTSGGWEGDPVLLVTLLVMVTIIIVIIIVIIIIIND